MSESDRCREPLDAFPDVPLGGEWEIEITKFGDQMRHFLVYIKGIEGNWVKWWPAGIRKRAFDDAWLSSDA